jgi:hypothetical protein
MLAVFAFAATANGAVRFHTVDVYVDSDAQLAAWQVEVRYDRARVKIVGLEGGEAGEDAAWGEPPHYDARGKEQGRIVLAAFVDDDAKATTGRARVVRLHLQIELPEGADADVVVGAMTVRLVTAAQAGGERITPEVELVDAQALTPEPRIEADEEDVL